MGVNEPDPEECGVSENPMDLRHLRREIRTALELAIVAMAPSDLVDQLATSSGLLEAVSEFPVQSAPVVALIPRVLTGARRRATVVWFATTPRRNP